MVRPDALADLLGFSGFLLTGARARGALPAGVALLVLASLTKQTAGVFLLAAALALVLEGQRRRALVVLGGGLAILLAVVGLVTTLLEPAFLQGLLGERLMPWDLARWCSLLYRVYLTSGDVVVLPLLGLVLWQTERPRAVGPAALAVVLLVASFTLSGKEGADLNYFLWLRLPAALAVAALWRTAHAEVFRPQGWLLIALTALAVYGLFNSMAAAVGRSNRLDEVTEFHATARGQGLLLAYREACTLARDPDVRLLTDSGLVDLYQGERALFGDPWLFRKLVETGRLAPRRLIAEIDAGSFDVVITANDIFSDDYAARDFRLPIQVLDPLRRAYIPRERHSGLYYYGPRGGAWPPPHLAAP
jgi:hypothetical protein